MRDETSILVHLNELEGKLIVSNSLDWFVKALYETTTDEELTDEKLQSYQIYMCGLVNGIRYCLRMEPFEHTSKFVDVKMFLDKDEVTQ